MSIEELREEMKKLVSKRPFEPEKDHQTADNLLLDFINDEEVRESYEKIEKWYS